MKQKDDRENFLEHARVTSETGNQNLHQLYKPQGAAGLKLKRTETSPLVFAKECKPKLLDYKKILFNLE